MPLPACRCLPPFHVARGSAASGIDDEASHAAASGLTRTLERACHGARCRSVHLVALVPLLGMLRATAWDTVWDAARCSVHLVASVPLHVCHVSSSVRKATTTEASAHKAALLYVHARLAVFVHRPSVFSPWV